MLGSSLQKIYLKHACARNRHKSEYDDDGHDDGVVTLDSNIKFHVRIFYYILNKYFYIIITLLLRISVVKHYYEVFDRPNMYFFTLFLFCNKIFNEKIRECIIFSIIIN